MLSLRNVLLSLDYVKSAFIFFDIQKKNEETTHSTINISYFSLRKIILKVFADRLGEKRGCYRMSSFHLIKRKQYLTKTANEPSSVSEIRTVAVFYLYVRV